jgi:hypothetical protein
LSVLKGLKVDWDRILPLVLFGTFSWSMHRHSWARTRIRKIQVPVCQDRFRLWGCTLGVTQVLVHCSSHLDTIRTDSCVVV